MRLKMKHEKISQRSDGSKIKIEVFLYTDFYRFEFKWSYLLQYCAPGKRKFENFKNQTAITDNEILETQLELWQLLKPGKLS